LSQPASKCKTRVYPLYQNQNCVIRQYSQQSPLLQLWCRHTDKRWEMPGKLWQCPMTWSWGWRLVWDHRAECLCSPHLSTSFRD